MRRTVGTFGLIVTVVTALGFALPAGAVQGPPYSDADAVGAIGLCNEAGQQITSGSISTAPFAWRAVSSQPAQGPYGGGSRTATLYAYQPIMGLGASDWSGDALTASARYSNPALPMAAATSADESLAQYMLEFKPEWDGFLELRIYLGADNEPEYSLHYPALNIQVTGQTWQAVGGGSVNCHSGSAESIESILLPSTTTTTLPGSSAAAGGHSATGGGTHTKTGSTTTQPDRRASAVGRNRHVASANSPWPVIAIVLALGVLALAVILVLVRRRRHRSLPAVEPASASPSHPEPPSPIGASSTKGSTP